MISLNNARKVLAAPRGADEQLPGLAFDALMNLAKARLDRETMETRNSDSLDFMDLSVWQIRDLIARAYAMGVRDATIV